MIRVVALHLDAYGHVRFTIHVDDVLHATTDDALEAAKILHDLGVERPLERVKHAREWGTVEIAAQ
jgi:hypothetical protein